MTELEKLKDDADNAFAAAYVVADNAYNAYSAYKAAYAALDAYDDAYRVYIKAKEDMAHDDLPSS